MRDSILAARRGLPAVALVTSEFWPQGDFVSQANGMPDIPRVRLPHPVAGTSDEVMETIADDIAPLLIDLLSGTVGRS